MKKFCALVVILTLLCPSAYAEGMITFSGKTDFGKMITVMTVKDNGNYSLPDFDDIGYINQTTADENGNYAIGIPISQFDSGYKLFSNENLRRVIYVSQNGDDSADGSKTAPYKTLLKALSVCGDNAMIVLSDIVSVPNGAWYNCDAENITISGKNPENGEIDGGLDFTKAVGVHFNFSVTFENMTFNTLASDLSDYNAKVNKIFACGNKIVFGENLTMDNPIDVFGGHSINHTVESTDVTVKSGIYRRMYGGGEQSAVTGDTHIKIYGMNEKFSANDDNSNYYKSWISGGGKNSGATVGGGSYIEFYGGVCAVVSGVGIGAEVLGDTHITQKGGRIMNIYGGSADEKTVHKGNSHISIEGGTAESVFGGSYCADFIGNTDVSVTDGEILRRIYGGCYNDWTGSWKGDCSVSGTACVTVGKNEKIVTLGDLKGTNRLNAGIFGGSRTANQKDSETAVVIFSQNSYDEKIKYLGDVTGYDDVFKPFCKFIVKSGEGGSVVSKGENVIGIMPNIGKNAVIGGETVTKSSYTLSDYLTEITFADGITLSNADIKNDNGTVKPSVYIGIGKTKKLSGNEMLIAVISNAENDTEIKKAKVDKEGNYAFDFNINSGIQNTYVKFYLWDMTGLKPLGEPVILAVR